MGWMLKLVIFTMGFLVLTYWLRNLFGRMRGERKDVSEMQRSVQQRAQSSKQTITCCNYCGVFVPQSEIVRGRLGDYCSKEHCDRKESHTHEKNR